MMRAMSTRNAAAWLLTPALVVLACTNEPADAPSKTEPAAKADDAKVEATAGEAKREAGDEAKTEAPAREPMPMAGLEGAHVVVAAGSRFYSSADAEQPLPMRSYRGEHEPGQFNARHVGWVMRLGEVSDERVQVHMLDGDEPRRNCGRGMAGLEAYELSAWVERSALVPVTTKPVELRYADGTSATFFPGTPVLPASEDEPEHVDAWGVELPIGDATLVGADTLPLGPEFVPSAQPAFAGELGALPEFDLQLAGARLESAALGLDGGFMRRELEVEGQARIQIRGRCIEVEALVTKEPAGLGLGDVGALGTIGGGYAVTDQHLFLAIPAGTPVEWGDGTPAGKVRSDQRVYAYKAPGSGRCIYQNVGDGHQQVALCFPRDAVRDLQLGWVQASGLKLDAEAEFDERRLQIMATRLRQPCLSHALERDPKLDLHVGVTARYGPEKGDTPGEVTVAASKGKLDKPLRACLVETIGAWKHYALLGREAKFELHLSGTRM